MQHRCPFVFYSYSTYLFYPRAILSVFQAVWALGACWNSAVR